MAHFKLIKHKFPLDIYLRRFRILLQMKQCTTCQRTNNHDITNHSVYQPHLDYLLMRPTNARIWHKAVFYGGSSRRAEAHTRPARPKIPTVPSAFPLLGAPQAPGNKPQPPNGVKPGGMAP